MSYRGADVIAEGLAALGVEHVFGIVSIHNMPIFEAINQLGNQLGRSADAFLVRLGTDVRTANIVPGTHHETLVDGNRHHRRMRKEKTDTKPRIEPQFRHDRLEVMPVGA